MRPHRLTGILFLPCLLASTSDLAHWRADYSTPLLVSPPLAHLSAHVARFESRNSPPGVRQLATELFSLMDMRQVPAAQALLQKGDYQGALDAYRDFFIDRLRFPPAVFGIQPVHPDKRLFVQFIHNPDELLDGIATFCMLDKAGKRAEVKLKMGIPGQVNYVYKPEGFQSADPDALLPDERFVAQCTGAPNFYTPLISEYLKTHERKYLLKWAEYMEARAMFWREDVLAAGLNVAHGPGDAGIYMGGVFSHLAYLSRAVPGLEKDLPSATLARMLLDMWREFLPINLRSSRETIPNRHIEMYSQDFLLVAVSMPEFHPAQYLLREKVRIIESYPSVCMMPDGSDIEYGFGYNWVYLDATSRDWRILQQMTNRPPWIDALWHRELFDSLMLRGRFLMHHMLNDGRQPYPMDYRDMRGSYFGPDSKLFHDLPETQVEPENARILSTVFGDGTEGKPRFTSEYFPYLGLAMLRGGWDKQDQYLYMASTRPHTKHSYANQNDIQLFAYGQPLLYLGGEGNAYMRRSNDYSDQFRKRQIAAYGPRRGLYARDFTPVYVDDTPQITDETWRLQSDEIRYKLEPAYGKHHSAIAYHEPLKRRFHTSADFDFTEGLYDGPFIKEQPRTLIYGVSHQRQVLFARKLGLWVVTDRMRSQESHRYNLDWKFAQPFVASGKKIPGFAPGQIVSSGRDRSVKTDKPDSANLSIYEFSPAELEMTQYGAKFSGAGEQTVVSVLYPRRSVDDELKDIHAQGPAGFEATLPSGAKVLYQAGAGGRKLEMEGVAVDGEALLLAGNRGLALGAKSLSVRGQAQKIEQEDFEFELAGDGIRSITPIYRPMDLVQILPDADRFTDSLEISMTHGEPGSTIRYTVDGSEPNGKSPLYRKPFRIQATTVVKARAFRSGVSEVPPVGSATHVTVVTEAVFTRDAMRQPAAPPGTLVPGLNSAYYEGFNLSTLILDSVQPVSHGIARDVFDLADKKTDGVYAFVYSGYLEIPREGVYSFYAPKEMLYPSIDAGYDLRVFLGKEEWYPATRWHNFGAWSVPLRQGRYPFQVVYVDQRGAGLSLFAGGMNQYLKGEWTWRGVKPELLISGPGLQKQKIPTSMFFRSSAR